MAGSGKAIDAAIRTLSFVIPSRILSIDLLSAAIEIFGGTKPIPKIPKNQNSEASGGEAPLDAITPSGDRSRSISLRRHRE